MQKLKPFLRFSIWTVLIFVILISGSLLYIGQLRHTLEDDLFSHLKEVAAQGVKIINTQVEGDINSLESAAALLAHTDKQNQDHMTLILVEQARYNNFKRTGFAFPSGKSFLSDNLMLDVSQRDYFKKALAGQWNISNHLTDMVDGQDVMVEAVPVIGDDDVIQGVLYASNNVSYYAKSLDLASFDGQGFSIVIRTDGEKVLASGELDPAYKNIFDDPKNIHLDPNGTMRRDMSHSKSGVRIYNRPGMGDLVLTYMPVGINDWFLISVVPAKAVTTRQERLLWVTLILCVTGLLLFSALLYYINSLYKNTQKTLYDMAYTDPVTKHPNWTKMKEELPALLQKNASTKYAFVALDINKFKTINELYGYAKGDMLLMHIGQVLQESLSPTERFSRVGGDVFQLILTYQEPEELPNRLQLINEKIIHFQAPDKASYHLIISFGIYLIENRHLNGSEMLNRALLALRTVKGNYRDIVAFYSEPLRQQVIAEKEIESDMETALLSHQFTLVFCPVADLNTGRWTQAQGLAQWNHPTRGVIAMESFLPVFSKNGFIAQLNVALFEEACRLQQSWKEQSLPPLTLAIGFAVENLADPFFAQTLAEIARTHGVDPHLLQLDLPQKSAEENLPLAMRTAEKLHQNGFALGISQFGSQLGSLKLLPKLKVDCVRIEPRLFTAFSDVADGQPMAHSFVQVVRNNGVALIFDGVSTADQADFLKQMDCPLAQGPFIATNLTADELTQKLQSYAK